MNTDKTIIHRLKTGVPGMDEVLGGGLPEFSFNLIAGQPGSGKTTLAHQIMFALATPERPALYFTVLGEPPIKMLRYQQQFDFFDLDKVNRSIRFINLSEDTAASEFDKVMARIASEPSPRRGGWAWAYRSSTTCWVAGCPKATRCWWPAHRAPARASWRRPF